MSAEIVSLNVRLPSGNIAEIFVSGGHIVRRSPMTPEPITDEMHDEADAAERLFVPMLLSMIQERRERA